MIAEAGGGGTRVGGEWGQANTHGSSTKLTT